MTEFDLARNRRCCFMMGGEVPPNPHFHDKGRVRSRVTVEAIYDHVLWPVPGEGSQFKKKNPLFGKV